MSGYSVKATFRAELRGVRDGRAAEYTRATDHHEKGLSMVGLDVAVGFLASWAVSKGKRLGRGLNTEANFAVDSVLGRLHEVVATKLTGDPSLAKLQSEAVTSGAVSTRTKERVRLALEDASDGDPYFADQLQSVLRELQAAEGRSNTDVQIGGTRTTINHRGGRNSKEIVGSPGASIVDIDQRDNHWHGKPDPLQAFFDGKGPGRLLIVLGIAVAAFMFIGWMSLIMNNCGPGSPTPFQNKLPSNVPVAAVYFVGFGTGGLVAAIGAAMARSGKARSPGYWVMVALIIAGLLYAVNAVLAGASPHELVPKFGNCSTMGFGR